MLSFSSFVYRLRLIVYHLSLIVLLFPAGLFLRSLCFFVAGTGQSRPMGNERKEKLFFSLGSSSAGRVSAANYSHKVLFSINIFFRLRPSSSFSSSF